jgi:hypothetical protein
MEANNKWWLAHYPAGIAHEIDLTRYTSLNEMADEAFAKFGARAMYTCLDKRLPFVRSTNSLPPLAHGCNHSGSNKARGSP